MRSDFEQIVTKYAYSKLAGLRGTEVISREGKLVFKHRFHSEQEASDYAQYRENLTMGHGIAFIIDPDVTKSVLEIR